MLGAVHRCTFVTGKGMKQIITTTLAQPWKSSDVCAYVSMIFRNLPYSQSKSCATEPLGD